MLSTRNFIKIANIARLQQTELLRRPLICRSLNTSSWLTQQSKDQETDSQITKIYYGTLTPNIKSVKVFSITTSVAGICAQPILFEQAAKLGTSTPVIVIVCGFLGFFTFVTPVLIHLITKRYVTEMHYDPITQEYIASIINFFLVTKEVKFKIEDVIVPEIPGMFEAFKVKPKGTEKPISLFVDPKLFEDPTHYVKIMGFDKPIDFRLDLTKKQDGKN